MLCLPFVDPLCETGNSSPGCLCLTTGFAFNWLSAVCMHIKITFLSNDLRIYMSPIVTSQSQSAGGGAMCLYPTFVKIFLSFRVHPLVMVTFQATLFHIGCKNSCQISKSDHLCGVSSLAQ